MKNRALSPRPSPQRRLHEAGAVYTVREAKAGLSAILHRVAEGTEVTIASRGRPVARIVPLPPAPAGFAVDREWLRTMRVTGSGPPAEQIVREDRDARG